MEARRRRKEAEEQERRQAMRRGWNLLQGYGAAEPGNLATEEMPPDDLFTAEAREQREMSRLIQSEISLAQTEVVGWIELAMISWFDFYFAIGRGSARDRLDNASESLGKAADRLLVLGEQIRHVPGSVDLWDDPILIYSEAVDAWSSGFDLIARGARFDSGSLATAGLAALDKASEKAERVVITTMEAQTSASALATLRKLKPRRRTPPKTVERAKTPWSRALIAAGSPFDWTARP